MSTIFNTEISSIESKDLFNWGYKVKNGVSLSSEEKEMSAVMDAFARELGNGKGDSNKVIAELVKKVVEPEVYNTDGTLLERMFDIGSIGEFDKVHYSSIPENTLKVYDGIRGGNVEKSYLDSGIINPVTIRLQAETQLKMSDLRRNGYKSIANLITLSEEALQNEKFYRIMNAVDVAIGAGTVDQTINNAGQVPLTASLDAITNYMADRADGGEFLIGLSKYIRPIGKMSGFTSFLSEDMKNELNRTGKLSEYAGVRLEDVSGARHTGLGQLLIPDNRILGIAGKIGELNMKGDLRVLETEDNDKEIIKLKFTGFDMEYAIKKLDKMARIVFA